MSNSLVMGPWVHGGWARHDGRRLGSVDFAADTATYYRDNVLLPFFESHLKDGDDVTPAGAHMFETGTNVWRRYPPGPRRRRRARYCTFARAAASPSSRPPRLTRATPG